MNPKTQIGGVVLKKSRSFSNNGKEIEIVTFPRAITFVWKFGRSRVCKEISHNPFSGLNQNVRYVRVIFEKIKKKDIQKIFEGDSFLCKKNASSH